MNRLELALLDTSGIQLELYLEDSKTKDIMADIEEIKRKAASTTDAGALIAALLFSGWAGRSLNWEDGHDPHQPRRRAT